MKMILRNIVNMRHFLWILLLIQLYPIYCNAHDALINGIYYNLDNVTKTAEVTYKDDQWMGAFYSGDIVVPEVVVHNGISYKVVSIHREAFSYCIGLTSISLPNTVISIGQSAFFMCKGLESFTVPNSVTIIEKETFYGCLGLRSIDIPDNVTIIKEEAFRYCSKLTSIVISMAVNEIGDLAFSGCESLISVTMKNPSPFSCPSSIFDNDTYEKATLYVPKGSKSLYESTRYWKLFKEIIEMDTAPITNIFEVDGLFYKVLSSDRVEVISHQNYKNIKGELVIPERVKYSGKEYVVTSIGVAAFSECGGITGMLKIPNTVTTIGEDAFRDCSGFTDTLTIHSSVISIASKAFMGCNGIEIINVDNSNIVYDSRDNCNAIINSSTNELIFGCKSTTIPNGVVSIADWAFYKCNDLPSVIIPNSVVSIGLGAFERCNDLSSITIPNSVEIIGDDAFMECQSLILVKSYIEKPYNIKQGVFYRISSSAILEVPKGTRSKYQAFYNWRESFKDIVEMDATSTNYTLFITVSGNGSATYDGTTIRSKNSSFTVNDGSSAIITFSPDYGYRIKTVKVNGSTVSVSNNQYTVSNIRRNTTVEVEFEAIPPMTYTLSITASGNGSALYSGATVRGNTSSFTVNAGSSATITFTPDNGYRIKSVKVNSSTVSVSNNQYTINSINANTTVSVEFEAIPVTTYTLSITASGNGSASYSDSTIRGKTSTFTVNAGSSATITFTPDNGYRIKSVKVNNTTVSVSNNQYTVSNINANTTVSVEFEAIPPTTYTLSITASGNGSVSYGGTTIRSKTSSFTLNAGSSATITFSPDNGYRIKSVMVNNSTVTVSDNQYTISSINANTMVSVEFEAIPVTYTLSITASGNGSASYDGTTIRSKTSSFTVNEGTTVKISITPDNGYRIKSVKENNTVVTSYVSNGIYTINSLSRNTTVEVEFEEILQAFSADDVNYTVVSVDERTIRLAKGSYGITLEVPAKVNYQNAEWTVTGIDNGALANNPDLAAIVWNPDVAFTEQVSNPNLLLYVNQTQYAPSSIKNVVVNGNANSITLTDAASGNNFYCPQAFTAQKINYTHNYGMQTGIGEAKGWETIVLPFDVQKVTHESKGEIVSFANWRSGDSRKPFWLMQLSGSGWTMAESIKANTPYIICMPNNQQYIAGFLLNGRVTFSAENVSVAKTEDLSTTNYSDRTFVPTFSEIEKSNDVLPLNVVNDIERVTGGSTEGSTFERNLRPVHPFEAYMTSTSSTRSIGIDEGMMTGIIELTSALSDEGDLRIYNLNGQLIKIEEGRSQDEVVKELPAGVYVVNGHIIIIK